MSKRTSAPLAALLAAPLLALAASAGAQQTSSPYIPQTGTVKPLPTPNKDVFTTIGVYDDVELAPISGVDIMIEPEGMAPMLATTGYLGATESYLVPNGSLVGLTLQETPIAGGVALGAKTRFKVAAKGNGILNFSRQLTQPTAHSIVVDDNGTNEQRVFPEGRAYPFWDINVVPKSGVKFDADVGMLVNADVVDQVLKYYGYPGDTDAYTRGLFMRVNTPGGAQLGEDGIGLVMHNYGPADYNSQQLDVMYFSSDVVVEPDPTDGERRVVDTSAVANFTVAYKALDDSDSHALYYLGGDMPEGYLFFLWRDGKEGDYSEIESFELDTPEFVGSKDAGIDVVDLSGDEPTYSNNCTDCDPGLPNYDPSWTCTPPAPSAWTSFWWFGCPGDGTPVGGAQCSQWALPVTPIFCDTNGSIQLCVSSSQTISLKAKLKGGEIGGSVTVTESMCTTANITPGPNGCGECVRLYGVGLICAQEYSNHDDVVCNEGGYCFGHTWTKDCYEYDPVITRCVDVKITVSRCSRG